MKSWHASITTQKYVKNERNIIIPEIKSMVWFTIHNIHAPNVYEIISKDQLTFE